MTHILCLNNCHSANTLTLVGGKGQSYVEMHSVSMWVYSDSVTYIIKAHVAFTYWLVPLSHAPRLPEIESKQTTTDQRNNFIHIVLSYITHIVYPVGYPLKRYLVIPNLPIDKQQNIQGRERINLKQFIERIMLHALDIPQVPSEELDLISRGYYYAGYFHH